MQFFGNENIGLSYKTNFPTQEQKSTSWQYPMNTTSMPQNSQQKYGVNSVKYMHGYVNIMNHEKKAISHVLEKHYKIRMETAVVSSIIIYIFFQDN